MTAPLTSAYPLSAKVCHYDLQHAKRVLCLCAWVIVYF